METPSFPRWHFGMLADNVRSALLERAIKQLDPAGRYVLEIGAGTGILALLCARHGASHVVACEQDMQLAQVAQRIVSDTPYSSTINVYACSSSDLIDRGLHRWQGRLPDVIISETLDCGVVGEGFFAIAKDIRRACRTDTIIAPSRVEQYGFLVEAPGAWGSACVSSPVLGFDLSKLNEFTAPYTAITEEAVSQRLSNATLVRMYDYMSEHSERIDVTSYMTTERDGICHGLVTFFRARFGETIVSNGPGPDRCYCWNLAFHPLKEPVHARIGATFKLSMDPEGRCRVL